jgi:membrane dipeptidase
MMPAKREILLTPGPVSLSASVRAEMARDRPSHGTAVKAAVREAAAYLLRIANTEDGVIAVPLPGSATNANDAIISTFVPAGGKLLVVSNGTYGDRLVAMCKTMGLAHMAIRTPDRVPFPVEAVRSALSAEAEISHVMIVHCETSGGIINPLPGIASLCAESGKKLLVDAVSSFGAIPLDMKVHKIHALALSSNKCLEGPPGMAWVIADRAELEGCAGRARCMSLDVREQWQHLQRTGSFRFTPPTHVVMGFMQALREHAAEGGAERRLTRYRRKHRRLVAGLHDIGLQALVKEPAAAPIVGVFPHPTDAGYDYRSFCAELAGRGYHLFPGSGAVPDSIRIGCIGQIDEADIDGAIDAMADLLKRPRSSRPRFGQASAKASAANGRAGSGDAALAPGDSTAAAVQGATEAETIIKRALVWDAHSCMPLRTGMDLAGLERHRASGIAYVSLNVGMDMTPPAMVIRVIAHFRDWLLRHPDRYVLASSIADVTNATANGKLAVGFDLEGALPLSGDLALVQLYADLGVRQIHFVYNRNNVAGGGCHDAPVPLSAYGRQLVEEVNRVGLLMDCSHTGYRTSLDIIEASSKPVVFSHSNVHDLCPHPRNIREEQIRACAASGGVIGITGFGLLLGDARPETMAAHIDHIVQMVGPGHVGIGLDYVFHSDVDDLPWGTDRGYWWPAEGGYGSSFSAIPFIGPEQLTDVVTQLLAWKYAPADIEKILGLNFMRVAGETWLPHGGDKKAGAHPSPAIERSPNGAVAAMP